MEAILPSMVEASRLQIRGIMITWTNIMCLEKRPPKNQRLLLGRWDYGFANPEFTGYIARLKRPADDSPKYHPDYHHWVVQTPQGDECWEISAQDEWAVINKPEPHEVKHVDREI